MNVFKLRGDEKYPSFESIIRKYFVKPILRW